MFAKIRVNTALILLITQKINTGKIGMEEALSEELLIDFPVALRAYEIPNNEGKSWSL